MKIIIILLLLTQIQSLVPLNGAGGALVQGVLLNPATTHDSDYLCARADVMYGTPYFNSTAARNYTLTKTVCYFYYKTIYGSAQDSNSSSFAIIGAGAIGGLVLFAILIIVVRRRRANQKKEKEAYARAEAAQMARVLNYDQSQASLQSATYEAIGNGTNDIYATAVLPVEGEYEGISAMRSNSSEVQFDIVLIIIIFDSF